MNDLLGAHKAMLPWLFPLTLVLIVVAVAFVPSPVLGAVGVVVFLALATSLFRCTTCATDGFTNGATSPDSPNEPRRNSN